MRGMFGLLALLVGIGVMVYLFAQHEIPVAREGKKAQDQSRQISGRGQDGQAAIHSFQVDPKMRGNKLESLNVTGVTPGGALDDYGLKKGDQIIKIGDQKVSDVSNDDPELAKSMVHDAYQKSQTITVLRSGNEVVLPQHGKSRGELNDLTNVVGGTVR
jgi:S1-C subfamily serine protease